MGGLLTTSYIDNRAAIEIVDEPKHCSADSEEVKDLPPCVERRRKQLRKFGEHLLDRGIMSFCKTKSAEFEFIACLLQKSRVDIMSALLF